MHIIMCHYYHHNIVIIMELFGTATDVSYGSNEERLGTRRQECLL